MAKSKYENVDDYLEAEIRMITKLIHRLVKQIIRKAERQKKRRQ